MADLNIKKNGSISFAKIHFALWLVLSSVIVWNILIPAYKSPHPYTIRKEENRAFLTSLNDFPSHFNFVKSAWLRIGRQSGERSSVYSIRNHLRINSEWMGTSIDRALPFGYSPTMLWVLAPLVPLSHITALIVFNILGLACVWWQTSPTKSRIGLGLLPLASPIAIVGFVQGQTAFLTGTGLLFLYGTCRDAVSRKEWKKVMIAGIVLWALTAKPPFALTAAAILLGLRRWSPLIFAAGLTIAMTLIVSPLLGGGWWLDYLHMLTHYNTVQAASIYNWSFHPELMANLRGLLNIDWGLPDDLASKVSFGTWFTAIFFIATIGPRLKISYGGLWALGILSYLTLCPHVSPTEEIQIILIIPFCVSPDQQKPLRWHELLLCILVLPASFLSPAFNSLIPSLSNNRLCLFSIKCLLGILVVLCCREDGKEIPVLKKAAERDREENEQAPSFA